MPFFLVSLRRLRAQQMLLMAACLLLVFSAGCKHGKLPGTGEYMYVSAPQANLRDHVATVYNRVGTVKNGERVEVLERQRRFARVRTDQKQEGWIEMRSLVPREIFDQFARMASENQKAPVQGKGITRAELNMHASPGRETDTLYQLAEGSKVEVLRRSTTLRATPEAIAAHRSAELARLTGEQNKTAPKAAKRPVKPVTAPPATSVKAAAPPAAKAGESKPAGPPKATGNVSPSAAKPEENSEDKPHPMDDWWQVRDPQGHVGWVLARMVDLEIPLDVAQYAEGQRIQAAFVLNTVHDEDKEVPQYLVLLNENKDGLPCDFNQVRVFTWNLKKHRYETGYREHFIIGFLPATVGNEDFGKEGRMPVFTLRKQNTDGSTTERKYRLMGNVARQVYGPGETAQNTPHAASTAPQKGSGGKAEKGKAEKSKGKAHKH